MTTRLPLAERRAQLVSSALDVAVAEGIAATTIRRVAEQAGVALGVVHYCFEDKDELFVALATQIVDDLAAAAAAALDVDEDAELPTALQSAVDGLWHTIEAARGEQLLTYEITTHALRSPGLHDVATRQYEVSQAAAEGLLELIAATTRATWTRPVSELAGEVLAIVDGVTLRWLVDGDGAAARARLASLASYLATQAKTARRARHRGDVLLASARSGDRKPGTRKENKTA